MNYTDHAPVYFHPCVIEIATAIQQMTSRVASAVNWSAQLSKVKELYKEKNSTVWRSEIATSHGNIYNVCGRHFKA